MAKNTTPEEISERSIWQQPLGQSVKINSIVLCIMVLILLLITLTGFLSKIILLVGITLLITYILLKPVDLLSMGFDKLFGLKNVKRNRILAIVIVYFLCGFLISGFSVQFFPKLSQQIQGFSNDLPRYYNKLENRLDKLLPGWSTTQEEKKETIDKQSEKNSTEKTSKKTALDQASGWLKQYSSGIVKYLFNLGTNTITSLVYFITGIVMVFYFLLDGEALRRGTADIMPERLKSSVNNYLFTIHKVMYYFIRIQLVMSFAAGLYLYILLSVYQFKYALLLGVIYGLASIIPVIGSWFGLIPTFLVALFKQDPTIVIPITIFIGIFFIFKTYWLLPKGLNYKFGIHPVIIILTFLICVQLVGPAGLFLVFPIASLIAGSYAHHQKKLTFEYEL